jgi:uncharacterized phage protein (TIGR02218 family)
MSQYDDLDRSRDGGRPSELFEFSGGIVARYASGQDAVTFNGAPYEPDYIIHGEIEQTEELNKQTLEITIRSASPVAALYVAEVPPAAVNVRVWRFIQGVADYRLVWAGRVARAVFSSANDDCVLECEPVFTLLKRPGLRRNYQIACPFALYDDRCGVQSAPYIDYDAILDVDRNRLTGPLIANRPKGWFLGGVIRLGTQTRMIIGHDGGWVAVAGSMPGMKVGAAVTAMAGCDKSLATCRDRFGNSLNFGGFPYMPEKNPFTGDSLYS